MLEKLLFKLYQTEYSITLHFFYPKYKQAIFYLINLLNQTISQGLQVFSNVFISMNKKEYLGCEKNLYVLFWFLSSLRVMLMGETPF